MKKMNGEYPEFFARFYDVIYHQLRDGADNHFFLSETLKTNGKILEIGVGTGRLFSRALNNGSDIYGLDISQHMLNVLLSKIDPAQWHRISLQNMIDFSYDFKFDLVIAPFRVIMHILNKHDQINAINNVFDHLNSNGRFIFDAFVPDLNHIINGIDNVTDFQEEYGPGKMVKRIVSTKPDLINQIIDVKFRLEWEENDLIKQQEWSTSLRFFFRYELEHLLERSEFCEYSILGDYQGTELNQDSKEFVVICRKY